MPVFRKDSLEDLRLKAVVAGEKLPELTHVDAKGDVRMVDVSEKPETARTAVAEGVILMAPETQAMVLEDRAKKGDVLACARVAGIMAVKRASDIIPMCHPLLITKSAVEIEPIAPAGSEPSEGWAPPRMDGRVGFRVSVTAGVTGKTGIEMEALMGASAACLTIYDMCKALDRGMEIVDVRLLSKEGGRSGTWMRAAAGAEGDAPGAQTERAAASDAANGASPKASAAPVTQAPAGKTGQAPKHDAANLAVSSAATSSEPKSSAPALAFVGYQNSGKTTLTEKVIRELAERGYRVGSLKRHDSKGFQIDMPGKDSFRHHEAGSRHVGLICPAGYAEYADTETELSLEALLSRYTDVDLVIVEADAASGLPNVVVARSGVDRLRGRDSLDLIDGNTVAVACNDALLRDASVKAAALDINDSQAVTDAVEAWFISSL